MQVERGERWRGARRRGACADLLKGRRRGGGEGRSGAVAWKGVKHVFVVFFFNKKIKLSVGGQAPHANPRGVAGLHPMWHPKEGPQVGLRVPPQGARRLGQTCHPKGGRRLAPYMPTHGGP